MARPPPAARLGIVVGLEAEAGLARRLGAMVEISGATASGAVAATARLLAGGADGLLSFGLAAGLDPALGAGTLLVPHAVLAGGRTHPTDAALRAWLGAGHAATLLHSDVLVSAASAKAALFADTGCGSLDMESGVVARAATAAGVPFAVLRAVCDPAARTLPPAARIALRPGGRLNGLAIAASILHRPGQLPGLIALGRDAGGAKSALSRRIDHLVMRTVIM